MNRYIALLRGINISGRNKIAMAELKEGFELEVYVNPNLIEVFVNDGEAVISNTVYDLGKEIETDVKMRIETLEK